MEQVQFNEESTARTAPPPPRPQKGFIGFLVKRGWAKDQKTAEYILGTIALLAFIISLFFWVDVLVDPTPEDPSVPLTADEVVL